MIPTRYKSKVPKSLSYPIGAEAISAALDGAPHFGSFGLYFHARWPWRMSDFRQRVHEGPPFVVLQAEYRPATKPGYYGANAAVEDGWYDAKWRIAVNAVPRELRHMASGLLLEYGLPAVAKWLGISQVPGWEDRRHTFELLLNPAEATLAARTRTEC
jgi:hypothetical protein